MSITTEHFARTTKDSILEGCDNFPSRVEVSHILLPDGCMRVKLFLTADVGLRRRHRFITGDQSGLLTHIGVHADKKYDKLAAFMEMEAMIPSRSFHFRSVASGQTS